MKACGRSSGITHFLRHTRVLSADLLPRTHVTLSQVALCMGYRTPYMEREGEGRMLAIPQVARVVDALKKYLWRDPSMLMGCHDLGFLVAPPAWPEEVEAGFGIKEPPTPYEVACALLRAPTRSFWAFGSGSDARFRCSVSALYWWLAGLPEETIAEALSKSRSGVREEFRYAISTLMGQRRFGVWALGIDLRPICTNPHRTAIARAFLLGKQLPSEGANPRRWKDEVRKMFSHPHLSAQLLSGRRVGPLVRPIYSPGVVWATIGEKRSWEQGKSSGAERVLQTRSLIRGQFEVPNWIELPLYDFDEL